MDGPWRFSEQIETARFALPAACNSATLPESEMGKGILLWLIGVPIPVILILWLLFR